MINRVSPVDLGTHRTPGETDVQLPDLLSRQIAFIHAGDLDGLMTQYAPNARLVRADLQVTGADAIRDVMATYLAQSPRVESVESFGFLDDTLVYVATLRVGEATVTGVGSFVLRGGLIWRQTAALLPRL